MNEYSYDIIRNDNNDIVVCAMVNGSISLMQPFDHRTPGTTPFANENEAISWAESWIAESKKLDIQSAAAKLQEEADAALDRAYKQAIIIQALGGQP